MRYILLLILLASCSVSKNLAPSNYLLSDVTIEADQYKEVLKSYVRQQPNESKIGLRIFNLVKTDTAKWLNRNIQKLGEAPVVYQSDLTDITIQEMKKEINNRGYYQATIRTQTDTIGRKIKLRYLVEFKQAHQIRNYTINIDNGQIDSLLNVRRTRNRMLIVSGEPLNMSKLEDERIRVTRILHNRGYFDLDQSNLHLWIDTTKAPFMADVKLSLQDSLVPHVHQLDSVIVMSGYDALDPSSWHPAKTLEYKGLHIIYDSSNIMTPKSLSDNILLRPKTLFSDRLTQKTYNFLNTLGILSRSQIIYTPSNAPQTDTKPTDTLHLIATILLSPNNLHGFQTGVEGTNRAGDLGVAANVSYTHYNLFNGAEKFTTKLRYAYEFVNSDVNDILTNNFYEIGTSNTLSFPQSVIPFVGKTFNDRFSVMQQYSIGLDMQKRVEYTRNFFNLSWSYKLENEARNFMQTWTLMNINYTFMPTVSPQFQDYLNQSQNSLSRFSYDNTFVFGIAYNAVFNKVKTRDNANNYIFRFGAETSGNILRTLYKTSSAVPNANGQYALFGNTFAQFAILNFDYSFLNVLSKKHHLAYRFTLGTAYAYGNSSILPFEKRYFGGGPNSIRGWNTRGLGPGRMSLADQNSIATRVGDFKLELSMEYRYKWFSIVELASFVDAGNIWTLRNYENQQGGQLSTKAYQEMAIGAGVGIRFDFTFLVLRIDFGKKMYDPAFIDTKPWVFFDPFKDNSALYLAIGLPI